MMTKQGTGVWLSRVLDYKLMWRGHDALYIAFGPLRIRVMKRGETRAEW